jgi:hypothetical protein
MNPETEIQSREEKFRGLPADLQKGYVRDPLVQIILRQYLCNKISRDEAMTILACELLKEKTRLFHTVLDYARRYGNPPLLYRD